MSRPDKIVRALRVSTRASRLCLHLLWGLMLASWLRWRCGPLWFRRPGGEARRRRWMQQLAVILGLRIQTSGSAMDTAGLLVANHISWLDAVAISAAVPTTFVAKDDVRRWPVIGTLATWSGTVFLRRANLGVLNVAIDTLAEVIRRGQRVTVFPEGTTGPGTQLNDFRRALYQSVVNAGAPVQAVAVRYLRNGSPDTVAPFIGDDEFVPHLLRIMAEPFTDVRLDFQRPLAGGDRRTLAAATRAQIGVALGISQRTRPGAGEPAPAARLGAGVKAPSTDATTIAATAPMFPRRIFVAPNSR